MTNDEYKAAMRVALTEIRNSVDLLTLTRADPDRQPEVAAVLSAAIDCAAVLREVEGHVERGEELRSLAAHFRELRAGLLAERPTDFDA